MSIQISCTICGESSARTVNPEPALEWSKAHRCTRSKLIELADERRTLTRVGKLSARETDRDLIIMGELVRQLAAAPEPQGEPSDAQVEAAAQAMFEPDGPGGEYTWAEMVAEDPSRADIWRADARKVLRAASAVTEQGENR